MRPVVGELTNVTTTSPGAVPLLESFASSPGAGTLMLALHAPVYASGRAVNRMLVPLPCARPGRRR